MDGTRIHIHTEEYEKEKMTTTAPTSRELLKEPFAAENKIHVKILITITLSVALSIIVLTILLYFYFENTMVNKIYESEKNNLFQAGVSTKLMQELARSIAIQMYNDFSLSGLFFTPVNDPVEAYNAITHFRKYKDLIPYIHSIYIFNPLNNTFYINSAAKTVMIQPLESFFDGDIISMLDNPDNFNSRIPIPRIIKEPGAGGNYENEFGVYTFIFNLSGVRSKQHTGTIIINISEKWVRDIIDSVDINPDIQVLIIDKNDRLLISDAHNRMLSTAGIYDYIKDRRLTGFQLSGNLTVQLEEEKTLLVFSLVESFQWIFIKLIPYNNIMDDIFRIRKNLIIIAVSILVVGILLSVLFAKRLYKPIDAVVKRLARIERERKTDTLLLKQYNLRRLFTQSKNLSDFELNRFLADIHFDFNQTSCFMLLLVEIDHYHGFCKQYTLREQNLLKLGILDTATDIIGTYYQNEGTEIGNNHLIFLLHIKNEKDSLLSTIISASKKIREKVRELYSLSVTIIHSAQSNNAHDISHLYDKVLEMVQYKYILGYGVIINEECIAQHMSNKQQFVYPYDKEKHIIEALHYADKDKILVLFDDIIQTTLPYGYNALVTTRNTLAYTINKTLNTLRQQNLLEFPFDFYGFFSELNASETIEESTLLFKNLFHDILQAIEKRNTSTHFSLVSHLKKTIETHYMDINLGISTFAYTYKLSAAYLGRLFKKYTGKSMPDYINEVRITRANELLKDTSYSMVKIMEMTGFTNKTHFYNMFKKYNGVTPKVYRQKIIDSKSTN
jgi:two-component system, response regulator YesN